MILINKNDEKIMLSLLEMEIRLAGEKDENEVQRKLKDDEYLDKAMRKMIATRCYQKLKKIGGNKLSKKELDDWLYHLNADFKMLPHDILKNVDEWNNDVELSDIELYGTSIKEVWNALDKNDDMIFLITLECFAMSNWFDDDHDLFLLHALGQMPVMWNLFPEKAINRRDNWQYYYELLKKIGKNITIEQVKRDTLLLDVADKIMRKTDCKQHYDQCIRSAETIVDYIPNELVTNIVEFIEDKEFSDIQYDGVNIKHYLAETYKHNAYQLEALFGYANSIKWGNIITKSKTKRSPTWKERIFRKKKD